MKKTILLLVVMIVVSLTTGCSNKAAVINTFPIGITAEDDIAGTAYNISEIITEINGTEMIIDGPKGCFSVPMQNMESSPEPQVGDILEVTYDGTVLETYPARFGKIVSLKVYKSVEMTAVITEITTDSDMNVAYVSSDDKNYAVYNWIEFIPDGPTFEQGDEIVITYNGIADEEDPAGLCGVVKIDLSHDEYQRKYGDKTNDETSMTVSNYNSLPPYVYSGDDKIEKAITEFFESQDMYHKPEGSVWIPAFCVFREEVVEGPHEEAKKGDFKVYGNFWSFVYSKQDDTLFCESGGEHPGVLYLKKNADEGYDVTYFDAVGDGSKYTEDIKRITNGNTSLEKQFFDSADANSADVKNKRTWNIYKYVKDNNLDIKYYQDYGWDPVDFNMEVNSWSNVAVEDLSSSGE